MKLIEEIEKSKRKHVAMAYSRVFIDTDYTIQLFHETKVIEKNGSSLGLRLASALKAFGLVNHSLWVALDNDEAEGAKA